MIPIPLGGYSNDYNSIKATGTAINMYVTRDAKGEFRQAGRTEGLDSYLTVGDGPTRS